MWKTLAKSNREYLSEALGLGAFMISAAVFATAFGSPHSPAFVENGLAQRALVGLAMGATAIAIFLSRLADWSGAHINPAVTLTFWRLGRISTKKAFGYAIAQFAGAAVGVFASRLVLNDAFTMTPVSHVVTVPGEDGAAFAFLAETAMSFIMMTVVLRLSSSTRTSRFTPFAAGILVAIFITFEAPLSGMSINPARTFGSSVVAWDWRGAWIYLTAPPLGMLAAAELFVRLPMRRRARKLEISQEPV